MTNINLYESVWEEITYSGWVELKRDGLNIKLDNEPSRYYKKIENKCSCGCHKQEGYEEGCDLCSESHDEKIDNLYTKQNGSHDLHPTSGYDSRWQTIIGNSGDTDKNTDKSQGFSNNKPMVSLDSFDSIIEDLELKVYNQRELLQLFLSSDLIIDDMDYNELLEWVNNEIEDDYINKFICEWKDYAFLRGKLDTANQLKEIVEKTLNKLKGQNLILDDDNLEELCKALGVDNEN